MKLTNKQIEELQRAAEVYYPCWPGVHVCGSDDTKNMAITVANIPARDEAEARRIFAACKAEAEAQPDEPQDLVVDLNIGRHEHCVEDFSMSRQMLDRCLAAGLAVSNGDR